MLLGLAGGAVYGLSETWGHGYPMDGLWRAIALEWIPALEAGLAVGLVALAPLALLYSSLPPRFSRWLLVALSVASCAVVARALPVVYPLFEYQAAPMRWLSAAAVTGVLAALVWGFLRSVGRLLQHRVAAVAVLVVAAVGIAHLALVAAGSRERPDVFLIVVDTLRADHLGFDGYERTTSPRIDELARDSIVYRAAYSLAPWTTPSMAGMLTSRYPSELGFTLGHTILGRRQLLLAELLRSAGYSTHAVVSHHFLGAELGFAQGFDSWNQSNAQGHRHVSSPDVIRRALQQLENAPRPTFLFLHLFDPHYDFLMHEAFPFDSGYEGPIDGVTDYSHLMRLAPELTQRDFDHVRSRYDSEIRFTDEHVGRFLDALRAEGRYDEALILFTADHGEAFAERGTTFIGHGGSLYRELVRVPLLVKLPGSARRGSVDRPVSLIGLAPTIAELAGVRAAARFRGRPFDESAAKDLPVFLEGGVRENRLGIVLGSWKLTREVAGDERLYDLEADAGESSDVLRQHPEIAADLAARLDAWLAGLDLPAGIEKATFSEQQLEELRALGYLE